MIEALTANTHAGNYVITAATIGTTTPASFSLTNAAAAAATIVATPNLPQSTIVNTPFDAAAVATVQDAFGNLVPGVSVTFNAPSSGDSGAFSTGAATISGFTDSNGQLIEPFTANTVAGPYAVVASTSGAASASFAFTNASGNANSIAATSGFGQAASLSTAFAAALVATVTDVFGNPVPGVSVIFLAPGSGAGANFSNGLPSITGTTNSR